MSHTLHRRGAEESLQKDIVFLMLPAHRLNDQDVPQAETGRKLRRFMEIGLEQGRISIGNASTGNVHTLGGIQQVLDSTTEGATVHCVFDDAEKALHMMQALKEADLGLSVVVSGLFDMIGECCRKSGLSMHTVEYSLGIWGQHVRAAGGACAGDQYHVRPRHGFRGPYSKRRGKDPPGPHEL